MDEYNALIKKYDKLCEERNDNSFWAENITEATEGVTNPIVWQNFYAYMANDAHKYSDWKESLGEQYDAGLKLEVGNQEFKTKTVQNGNVTYIRMTPDILHASNKTTQHEQMVGIPEGIPEEKSNAES